MDLPDPSLIELRGVARTTTRGEGSTGVTLHGVDLTIPAQVCTWLAGAPEGTAALLFRLLNLSERPDAGTVRVAGVLPWQLSPAECADFRAHQFGLVAAAPFFIPTFSAIENIAVPLMKISHRPLEEAQDRIAQLLRWVALEEKAEVPAAKLAPLERACLALARALAHGPRVLFVEDLRALLTPAERLQFAHLLRQSCERFGVAVVALEGMGGLATAGDHRLCWRDGAVEMAALPSRPSFS